MVKLILLWMELLGGLAAEQSKPKGSPIKKSLSAIRGATQNLDVFGRWQEG